MFEKERLIIPVFWKSIEHWLLAVVFFKVAHVRVYDSIKQPGGTRARAIHNRVMELLTSEHRQHYGTALPPSWEAWSYKNVDLDDAAVIR